MPDVEVLTDLPDLSRADDAIRGSAQLIYGSADAVDDELVGTVFTFQRDLEVLALRLQIRAFSLGPGTASVDNTDAIPMADAQAVLTTQASFVLPDRPGVGYFTKPEIKEHAVDDAGGWALSPGGAGMYEEWVVFDPRKYAVDFDTTPDAGTVYNWATRLTNVPSGELRVAVEAVAWVRER